MIREGPAYTHERTSNMSVSDDSWRLIFMFACSSIQDLHLTSQACVHWYRLIHRNDFLLRFLNQNLQRLLSRLPQEVSCVLKSDGTFMSGGAALAVLSGSIWDPTDIDVYSPSFSNWKFSIDSIDAVDPCVRRKSLGNVSKHASYCYFVPQYHRRLNFTRVCVQFKKETSPFNIDFIETTSSMEDVLATFDLSFVKNALIFEDGKIKDVRISHLQDVLANQGVLHYSNILEDVQATFSEMERDAWPRTMSFTQWVSNDRPSIRTMLSSVRCRLVYMLPDKIRQAVTKVHSRIVKYKRRGFETSDESQDGFFQELESHLGMYPKSPRQKRRRFLERS